MNKKRNLIWIDLEMTGLAPEKDRIIEIATLVTDANLNILAEGPILPIKHLVNQYETKQITNKNMLKLYRKNPLL